MNVVRTDITKNIFLNLRDSYYKVLVIENCTKNQNGLVYKTINENHIKHVVIDGSFHESVLDEVIDTMILVLMYNDKFDSDNLYKLKKLRSISIPNSYKMVIDFSNFKELEELDITWNSNLIFKGADSLKYLILRKFGEEVFDLELPQSLEFLQLIQGKLKSIKGIEKYKNLKALVLYSQSKIEDYSAIEKLKNLEFLHRVCC